MVARLRALGPPRAPAQVLRPQVVWPASRLNGTSPIRLLAAATLVVLGVALSAGRSGASEPSPLAAPAATTAAAAPSVGD
jgi:hypothetical protein